MKKLVFFFAITFLLFHQNNYAQVGGGGESGGKIRRTDKKIQMVPVPFLNYNRTIGFAMGGIPMAMYNLSKKDTLSPSSLTGVLGFWSTNKSWMMMGFSRFFFNQDNYRVTVVAGHGDFKYQTYLGAPIDIFLDYEAGATFAKLELQRRVYKQLYLGANYRFTRFSTTFDIAPDTTAGLDLHTLGLVTSFDRRNSVYYPTKGEISNINVDMSPEAFGNTMPNTKIMIDFNKYIPFRKGKDILATRLFVGFGVGDLSFNQQFIVGMRNDIRGYTQAKYRGNAMYDIQAEYRWNFHKKMAINYFFALATISGANDPSQNGEILPGGGIGLRYTVFPKNHMNVGLDGAVGKGDWGIYFRVGEAF